MIDPVAAERVRLDRELSPSLTARDAGGDIALWERASEKARQASGVRTRLGEAYGPHPRQVIDVWAPLHVERAGPLVAFVHGGFWQKGSTAFGGFPGPVFARAGVCYAAVGYRLAPEVPLRAIAGDVLLGLERFREVARGLGCGDRRIVVAGHSAGAQLAAALVAGPGAPAPAWLAGLVLIGGVYDLAPVARSYVNDAVRMTQDEIADLSPALHRPLRDVPVSILVGARETAEFQRQSALLDKAWQPHLSRLEHAILDGRDHFDIMHGLAEPGDPVHEAVSRQAAARERP
jgi:arylformamidase